MRRFSPLPQQTFAEVTCEQYRKPTRRERFRDEMNRVVPWADLVAAIEPIYPKAEGPGRLPVGVDRMLRLHCLQQGFNVSDPAVEEARYDSRAMRQFVGIDLGREPVPDETTICTFRHRLEAHQVGEQLFARIRAYLAKQGLPISRGTIPDAPIASAQMSAVNAVPVALLLRQVAPRGTCTQHPQHPIHVRAIVSGRATPSPALCG